jgi:hydrogenase maturation factor HypE
MARVLHLLKDSDRSLALDTIAGQAAAGDAVTVAILEGPTPRLPAAVVVRHLGADLTYPELVDLIFDADQVVPW